MRGEVDRHGNLATFVAKRGSDGWAELSLVDRTRAHQCIAQRLCQTCGQAIGESRLVALAAWNGQTAIKEAPLHLACAAYSLTVCPHLRKMEVRGCLRFALCHLYQVKQQVGDRDPLMVPVPVAKSGVTPSAIWSALRGTGVPVVDSRLEYVPRLTGDELLRLVDSLGERYAT